MQLLFTSFSVDDEDYRGFEYSLFGQLSEVRIVYLNRFIQEVIQQYILLSFTCLEFLLRIILFTPQPSYVLKLLVGGWLFYGSGSQGIERCCQAKRPTNKFREMVHY